MGKHRKNWTKDQLIDERKRLFAIFTEAKTEYYKKTLHRQLKSIGRELYTLTKETKYL